MRDKSYMITKICIQMKFDIHANSELVLCSLTRVLLRQCSSQDETSD